MFGRAGCDGDVVVAKIADKTFEFVGIFVNGDCRKTEVLKELDLFVIVD